MGVGMLNRRTEICFHFKRSRKMWTVNMRIGKKMTTNNKIINFLSSPSSEAFQH